MNNTCLIWLVNKIDKICKPTQEKRILMTKESVKNVTKHIKLPVILFHEDMTEEIKKEFINIYSNITFEKLDSFTNNNLPYDKNICKCSKGYMMMCRFFSGILQNSEALKNYDSYIRFDDDSFLIEPYININNFLEECEKYSYVFRSIFFDNGESINKSNGLFKFTYLFCKENNLQIENIISGLENNNFLQFKTEPIYTGLCPYNNFHYSKLSLWKHPIIKKYIDNIIEINGSLLYNWMDANIHAMIIFILCPLLKINVNAITNFGYRHNKTFSKINSVNTNFKNNESFYPINN